MIVGSNSKQMNSTAANAMRSGAFGSCSGCGRGLLSVACFAATTPACLNEFCFFVLRLGDGGGFGGIGTLIVTGAGGSAAGAPAAGAGGGSSASQKYDAIRSSKGRAGATISCGKLGKSQERRRSELRLRTTKSLLQPKIGRPL